MSRYQWKSTIVALAALLLAGCGQDDSDLGPGSADCGSMTRALCLNSTHCTLELTDEAEVYVCRDAVGLCEEGLLQSDIDACRAIEGCMPDDGECYCGCRGYGRTSFEDGDEAEDCLCACGGGEPPSCQPTPDPVPG